MNLPTPRIHYDAMRTSPPYQRLLAHLAAHHEATLRDSTGKEVFGYDFSRTYAVTYSQARAAYLYRYYGQEVVCVGPRMQESFAHTDLSRVDPDDVHLPYPCFYLAVPESSDLHVWGGPDTQWHAIDGAYVYTDPLHPDQLGVMVWGGPNERSRHPHDDALFWFSMDRQALRTRDMEAGMDALRSSLGGALQNINHDAVTVHLRREGGMEEALRSLLGAGGLDMSDTGAPEAVEERVKARQEDSLRRFFRIVVCTCLYLTSSKAEKEVSPDRSEERKELKEKIKRKRKRLHPDARRLQDELDRIPEHRTIWVGPTLERAVGAETDLTETGPRYRGGVGHYRRGHMHPYLVGPRKTAEGVPVPSRERERVYHWNPAVWVVGKKLEGDAGPRVYAVKEPEDE